jgi:hypothetical protein
VQHTVTLTPEEIEILLSALSSVRGEFGPLDAEEEALEARLTALIDPPLTPPELKIVREFSPGYDGTTSPTATLRRAWKGLYLAEIYLGKPHPAFDEWRVSLNEGVRS